jgi:DNA-binding NtrC family response regulator
MPWNHILLVEDDDSLRLTQAMYLEREGFEVTAVGSGAEAVNRIAVDQYQAVVTDLRLDEVDGLEVLAAVKRRSPETEVILITGFGSVDTAVEAMKSGAYDYLTKPVDPDDLVLTLKKAVERRQLRRQVAYLQKEVAEQAGLGHIVAASAEMQQIMTLIQQVSHNDSTVLIEGESGTGLWQSTVVLFPKIFLKANCLVTSKALLPAPSKTKRVCLRLLTVVPFSLTKSVKPALAFRSNSCVS